MRAAGETANGANFVERLRDPACYPHPAGHVELLETHISWVLLAGDFAYKIKKPVSLGFADFSSLERRRHFCEEELRLNRRTAADLYLDVVPITGAPASPRLGGEGAAFEYAVKMRRFPQEALLNRMASAGVLTSGQVEAFARTVADFHGRVARAGREGAFGAPRQIRAEAVDNFAQLELLDEREETRATRLALCAWTLRELDRLEPAFARRKHDGFVRECHGDLHLGNVALIDGKPVAFDAIEFNEAFRWIDVMNEVAFPVMDLLHLGHARLAHRFVDTYLEATGDFDGLGLLRFYLVYRAMVRAKVSCIRAHQEAVDATGRERAANDYRRHLELGRDLSRFSSPALIVMHGLSGSGKTTVSHALVEGLGAIRIRSDVERKRLHGLDAGARTGAAPGSGIYTPEDERLTYARLAALAGEVLDAGHAVVVDATFLKLAWRELFREFSRQRGAPFVLVACAASEAVLRQRVRNRGSEASDASEADIAVLEQQLDSLEPLAPDELDDVMVVETSRADVQEEAVRTVARRLGIEPA